MHVTTEQKELDSAIVWKALEQELRQKQAEGDRISCEAISARTMVSAVFGGDDSMDIMDFSVGVEQRLLLLGCTLTPAQSTELGQTILDARTDDGVSLSALCTRIVSQVRGLGNGSI